MGHIRLTTISLSLLLYTVSTFAQRRYENISVLELNYGTNLFGSASNYCNLSFPRCINWIGYWKAGLSCFEKPHEYTANLSRVSALNPEETIPETIHNKGKDFFAGGGYYRTLACNLKSVCWGIGLGEFIGTGYVRHSDEEHNFIIGPKLGAELEVLILPRTALLVRIQ